MKIQSLEDAFLHELKDVLYAEKQITKALPKMARHAQSDELREAFEEHLEQTKKQIERLEQVFESLGKSARAEKCEGITGIISEGEELMEEDVDESVVDALLISAAQRVEHYEIAAYGTLCAWAETLGLKEVKLLQETLQEEKETDERLTELAEAAANLEAAEAAEESDEALEDDEEEDESESDSTRSKSRSRSSSRR